ncbi:MAG: ABC transporter permease [Actinobacteria bacterium]|nr:ABC transporter permease [Actinomycetota bacterium]
MVLVGMAFVILAAVSAMTDSPELTSRGTFGAMLRLAVPILLAGLGGLWAERSGIVNIGLEGMMILGTWFGAWAGVEYGPWWGAALGVAGGAAGGLLHALGTVTFGINHIVSGVAINILAAGVARFLSVIAFTGKGGGATQSPQVEGDVGKFTLPFLSGGELFGWKTPDPLGWIDDRNWFLVSDVGAALKGFTTNLSWLTVIAILLVPISFWVLWRTVFGLRVRSVGEHPVAAESLGVRVYTMKYVAVTVSGALAGLGGAFLVLEAAGIYREGQTGGRGFIGLAALVFGNWRPGGVAAASGLFGYTSGLQLRSAQAVHGLLLFVAISLALGALWYLARRRQPLSAAAMVVMGGLFYWWFAVTETIPREFVFFTPHITTLLVLALASQQLRMPAADGLPYRRGQAQ